MFVGKDPSAGEILCFTSATWISKPDLGRASATMRPAEQTHTPRAVMEAALAQTIRSKVEAPTRTGSGAPRARANRYGLKVPNRLGDAVRLVAHLGGYRDRKHDPDPGHQMRQTVPCQACTAPTARCAHSVSARRFGAGRHGTRDQAPGTGPRRSTRAGRDPGAGCAPRSRGPRRRARWRARTDRFAPRPRAAPCGRGGAYGPYLITPRPATPPVD